ncbi:helicase HerA-like domain-containing protein [Taylorella equigenitalis]|uniref:helicase HerA-like domain-containing protein n=1 Tax=Taylorella equigenitalis TaxID=29575 RepID=UPI000427A71F|nr:helicase HerA-like domain-containing protein [Taylorella equigenitalis]ASY30273.1 ATP-binding protein [Taylorella equigenitalis]KOS58589.1 ATP-binding protein [Taylorella equigenitalis]
MAEPILVAKGSENFVYMLPKLANRHGCITGATGTGKTVTLQVLAQAFSKIGVPVFMEDVKGDLTGISQPGVASPKLMERLQKYGLPTPDFSACPVTLWDLFGVQGHPIRATISDMGPLLLSRILDLNDTQAGVLSLIFKLADDEGQLILDMKDLRAMLQYVSDRRAEIQETYGNVTPATVGAIQRKLLELEQQGADNFFGEPMLDIFDLMRVDHNGNGMVNILAADKLMRSPKLYGVFLLWLLAEIYEALPEVGDLEKPKFVFFFDEAHLVFEDAPDALLDKIELIVRLSRSKGIGVYFVTQNPLDIPEAVLGQLGNRVQHALRAYTPRDQKAVRTTAETMRPNPKINIEQAITELGVGEALVSLLDEKGAPSVTERAWMVAPGSRIGPITDLERNQLKNSSHVYGKYEKVVDRESAFEVLQKRATMANEVAQQEANSASGSSGVVGIFKDFMIGSTGPRGGHRDGIIQRAVKNEASRMTSRLIRGVLGSLLGGRR